MVPTPNPPAVWVKEIFCAPGATNILKLGPLGTDIVPVQSGATVYCPPAPPVFMIVVPPILTVPQSLDCVPSPLKRLPSITAFGTRFPPTFAYPSHCDRYKPRSMCSLHAASIAADPAVDVPGAIAAPKHANAQVNAKELIIIFVNFVFIVIVSFCLFFSCLRLFGYPILRVISGRSLRYRTETGARLRGEFRSWMGRIVPKSPSHCQGYQNIVSIILRLHIR